VEYCGFDWKLCVEAIPTECTYKKMRLREKQLKKIQEQNLLKGDRTVNVEFNE